MNPTCSPAVLRSGVHMQAICQRNTLHVTLFLNTEYNMCYVFVCRSEGAIATAA